MLKKSKSAMTAQFLFLPFLVLIIFNSCDISEPDRFYLDKFEQTEVDFVKFDAIEENQHIAGKVTIDFELENPGFKFERIIFFVDQDQAGIIANTPPYRFKLNTQNWTDGVHQLAFGFITDNKGFFTANQIPSHYYTQKVVFDQLSPTVSQITDFKWEDNGLVIRWDKNNDPNFYAYVVRKAPNYAIIPQPIDTIYDRNITSYLDTAITKKIGSELAYYKIGISNRAEEKKSDEAVAHFGETIPFSIYNNDSYFNRTIYIPEKEIIMTLKSFGETLEIISTSQNKIIKSLQDYIIGSISQNYSSNSIYLTPYGYHSSIYKLNLSDYSISEIDLFNSDLFLKKCIQNKNNRLYILSSHELHIVDLINNTILASKQIAESSDYTDIRIDSNNKYLYTMYNKTLNKINVEADTFRIEQTLNTNGPFELIEHLNKLVYVDQGYRENTKVLFYDLSNFELLNEFIIPQGLTYTNKYYVNDSHLYLSFSTNRETDSDPTLDGKIIRFNVNDFSIDKEWSFDSFPVNFFIMDKEAKMYVMCLEGPNWVINLNEK